MQRLSSIITWKKKNRKNSTKWRNRFSEGEEERKFQMILLLDHVHVLLSVLGMSLHDEFVLNVSWYNDVTAYNCCDHYIPVTIEVHSIDWLYGGWNAWHCIAFMVRQQPTTTVQYYIILHLTFSSGDIMLEINCMLKCMPL